jgi:hypothetical protein
LLPARLITEYRRGETAVMVARGASARSITGLALREGALLVIPAGVLAAVLTNPLVQFVARITGLRSAGVELHSTPGGATWLALAVGALICLAVFVVPWLRAGTDVQTRQRAGRSTTVQRAGLDFALLVLALLAYWEIRTISAGGSGPLVVIAPALAVVAGGLVAMRLLPLVARAAERLALRGRGMPVALGSAQVARRPSRHTGPALLVALALAIGSLSAMYGTTWHASQQDRADFSVGADLRIDNPVVADAVSPPSQGATYQTLPGVQAALPVLRSEGPGIEDRPLVVLGVDARKAPDVMSWRGDLRPKPLPRLLAPLADDRLRVPGAPIPPGATSIEIGARLAAPSEEDVTGAGSTNALDARLSLLMVDPDGMLHRLDLGSLPMNGSETTLSADLPASSDAPWAIAAFDLSYSPLGLPLTPTLELTVRTPRISRHGSTSPLSLPAESTWSGTTVVNDPTPLPPSVLDASRPTDGWLEARIGIASGAAGRVGTATSRDHVLFGLGLPLPPSAASGSNSGAEPIAGIATSRYLRATGSSVGSTILIPFGGRQLPVRIVASVSAIPTVPEGSDGVLVDLQTLNHAAFTAGWSLPIASEWWFATDSTGEAGDVLKTDSRLASNVHDRRQVADEQWQDPFARGAQTALLVGFVAAICFAAIGFTVNTAIAARERHAELALLRALGAPPAKVTRVIAVEQLIVVGLGAMAGLLLGALVAREVLPLIIVSPDGTTLPGVVVALPWPALSLLLAGSVTGLIAVTAALARSSARNVSSQELGGE